MKLLDVSKDNRYLYIHTDDGRRQQSLRWSGVAELEQACRAAIGKNIATSTWGEWDPTVWFQSIKVLDVVELNQSELTRPEFDSRIPRGLTWDLHHTQRIYGPPGTGKTTRLIETVVTAVESGMKPENIGYFAFTNVAADEARERIAELVGKEADRFCNFSTLHSLATRIGGALDNNLCTNQNLAAFDSSITFTEVWLKAGDAFSVVSRPNHPILDLYSLRLNTRAGLLCWDSKREEQARLKLEKFHGRKINPSEVRELSSDYYKAYVAFKKANNLSDYNDVIANVVERSFPSEKLPTFEVLIIDESQDLTPLQWDFVAKVSEKAKFTIIAGDDDQAIMESFGASPSRFNSFPTTLEDVVLNQSHRLADNLKKFVDMNFSEESWNATYPNRKAKSWHAREKSAGEGVVYSSRVSRVDRSNPNEFGISELSENDIIRFVNQKRDEDWLIMAPTRATCQRISSGLESLNIPHYLQRRDVLGGGGKIKVQTIHTSKGMGADNVALVCSSRGDEFMLQSDIRLLYVALTRSKKRLLTCGIHLKNPPETVATPIEFGEVEETMNNRSVF